MRWGPEAKPASCRCDLWHRRQIGGQFFSRYPFSLSSRSLRKSMPLSCQCAGSLYFENSCRAYELGTRSRCLFFTLRILLTKICLSVVEVDRLLPFPASNAPVKERTRPGRPLAHMPYNLGLADTLTAAGVNDGARVAELCLQEECSSLAALAELTPALLDRLVSRAGLKSLSEARFRRLVEDAQGVDRALPVSVGVIVTADAVPPPAAAVPADQCAGGASTSDFSCRDRTLGSRPAPSRDTLTRSRTPDWLQPCERLQPIFVAFSFLLGFGVLLLIAFFIVMCVEDECVDCAVEDCTGAGLFFVAFFLALLGALPMGRASQLPATLNSL